MPGHIYFEEIRRLLPYEPPLILIDEVIDWEPDKWIEVSKVVSGADPMVSAHFPEGPAVLSGAIQIELTGQAGLLLNILSSKDPAEGSNLGVLARCKASFYRMIRVGETVTVRVTRETEVNNITLLHGELTVHQVLAAKIDVYAAHYDQAL